MKNIIKTDNAPQPIGPYSQAVRASGDLLFISGQIPLTPKGELAGDDIILQTRQAIRNIIAILDEAGASISDVVKTTVLLKNMDHFADMNKVYDEYFGNSKPARAAFQAAKLPLDVLVEIEAIAVLD